MADHLIACVLGGTAPRAKTELHDIAFAVGPSIDAVHEQLLDGWFGNPRGLHIDAWCMLDCVAGYRITLADEPATDSMRLYFVNIGGYRPGVFGEDHALWFFAATGKAEAKALAKRSLLQDCVQIHKDYLYAVDDCLPLPQVGGHHVRLTPDPTATDPPVTSGYFPLPTAAVTAWLLQRAVTASSPTAD